MYRVALLCCLFDLTSFFISLTCVEFKLTIFLATKDSNSLISPLSFATFTCLGSLGTYIYNIHVMMNLIKIKPQLLRYSFITRSLTLLLPERGRRGRRSLVHSSQPLALLSMGKSKVNSHLLLFLLLFTNVYTIYLRHSAVSQRVCLLTLEAISLSCCSNSLSRASSLNEKHHPTYTRG